MYFIVFMFGVISSAINDKRRLSSIAFILVLAFLAYFRYGVGADYFAYEYLYSRLSTSVLTELYYGLDNQEVGFRLIGAFLKSLGVSYQFYIILIASINLIYIYKTVKNYSRNPSLSLLLYFGFYYFVWTFSGLRQGLTIAIGIYYLLKCLEDNKILRFTAIVILLSLIHSSSIILFILYFLSKFNFKKSQLILLSILSIIISILPIGGIVSSISWLPFINRITPYLGDYSLISVLDFQSLGRIFFLFIAIIFFDTYSKQDEFSRKIVSIYILCLALYFFLKFSELTAARLSIYGKILDILILPNIYYLLKDKMNKLIYSFFVFALCIAYLYKELEALKTEAQLITNRSAIITPYVNIFNKDRFSFTNKYYYYIN